MEDLLKWSQGGGTYNTELTHHVDPETLSPEDRARRKPTRTRPNRGRRKNTNRNPPLVTPPWALLEETGYPVPRDVTSLPTTPTNWRRGPRYQRWRVEVHERWGWDCHLCGHPGATSADHLVPLSVWPNQPYDARLARPAHGVEGCETCGVKCNSSRGNRALAVEVRDYEPPVKL